MTAMLHGKAYPRGWAYLVPGLVGLVVFLASAEPPSVPREAVVRRDFVGVTIDPGLIVNQQDIHGMACGPTSIWHALRLGNREWQAAGQALKGRSAADKIRAIIDDFGRKPSRDYGKGERWRPTEGIVGADLTDMVNEILEGHDAPPVEGMYLDRQKDEASPAFLRRIHGRLVQSLGRGVPVIVMFRSFAALPDKNFDDGHSWNGLCGHFVVITRVPLNLADTDKGFTFDFLDPDPGRIESGYVHVESTRTFTAARGNNEKWQWLSGSPFLLVTAPSLHMHLQDQPWWSRTNIILNYGLFAKREAPREQDR